MQLTPRKPLPELPGVQSAVCPAYRAKYDSAAPAEALANLRHKDRGFIVDAVRTGPSVTVDGALRLKVADAEAVSLRRRWRRPTAAW